jgi:hypothetical protein
MPESNETQRFDRLLDAMLTKPGPDASPETSQEDEDLRDEPAD